jgi:ankyrin repeat protein
MKQSYWIGMLVFLGVFTFSTAMADPIHDAAKAGNVDQVRQLIEKGADVNAKNVFGSTPLLLAAEVGHKDVAELLKKHGAKE